MTEQTPFDQRRLLPKGSFSTGPGLFAWIWATVATLALLAALISVSLLLGVIGTGGQRTLEIGETAALLEALGDGAPKALAEIANDDEAVGRTVSLRDSGVTPLLLRGDHIGPGWLIGLTRAFPVLLASHTAIPWLAITMVVFLIVHHLCELMARSSAEKVSSTASKRIRGSIHRQSLRLNLGDLDGRGRRQAQSLFTSQTDAISTGISEMMFHVVRDPVRVILCLLILVAIDWRLALLVFLPVAGAVAFNESEGRRGESQQKLAESNAQRALRLLSEGLGKSRLIRGYGMEVRELEKFDEQLGRYSQELEVGGDSWRRRQRVSWTMAVIVIGLVFYLVGMKVLFDTSFKTSDGALFFLLLGTLALTFMRAREVIPKWRRSRLVNSQINRFLDRIPDVSQAVGAKFLNPVEKGITFEGVTVTRGGRPLFENLELRLPSESRTAFVSLDPVEARAAAFLLPRFLEPESGRILFDGEDIAWGTLESLRAECCYVGGREPFFTGTVSENIAAGDDFTDGEILDAAKRCHIHKFISTLPDGYETVIGEHGQSLPPGQAFLLGLARAIVRDPAVLIIEEPECQLDDDLKALIEDAYHRALDKRTIVFLPRRLSTVRKADQVVLISEGKVAAMGRQNELVKKNELYRHWEYTTFSPFGRPHQRPSSVEQALADFGAEGQP